jgi:hypothetical protein
MDTPLRTIATAARSFGAAALAALALAGCGGGSDGTGSAATPPPAANETGTLLVSMTDADGDFVSYSVDVLSVTLERRAGGTVEVLPGTTRIDFAQLTELADLLSVATLAPGDFVGGTLRLDYSNAEVYVERGGEVIRANIVGSDGAPLGVTELDIELAARQHLAITRGRAVLLALDFDLAASHEIDLATSPPLVTAEPYVVAEVQPVREKELRVRGALVTTDVAAGSYSVDVRPWFRPDGNHGRVTVYTNSSTSFEIAGVALSGSAGLASLAAQPAGTATVAFGTLSPSERRFTATLVHAGESVSGERGDAVHGNIVARSGDILTVKGAFAVGRDRPASLRRTVLVEVGSGTAVLRTGTPGTSLDASALSVGQNIVAFGTLAEPATETAPATLDARNGRVRMLPTHLYGIVNDKTAGQVDLRLRAIDRLGIGLFDFAGTGIAALQDADPADYEVATGTLGLAGLTIGESARIAGFVRPFGSAPADFDGRTVVDHRDLSAVLGIGWGRAGTTAPFLSMGAAGLVIDLGNPSIGERHALIAGLRHVDLLSLTTPPTVAPMTGRALFGISAGGAIRLFDDFGEFSAELARRLAAGHAVMGLVAHGAYEGATTTLRAHRVSVHLAPVD